MATKRLPRPRDPLALTKLIGDIANREVADAADDRTDPEEAMRQEDTVRAKAEIIRRYRQVCADLAADQETVKQHQEAIQQCQAHQQMLAAQANDLEAAARVFGFDIIREKAVLLERARNQTQSPVGVPQSPPLVPIPTTPTDKCPTITELVLESIQQAFPDSVRVSEIRKQLAKRGIAAREETIGMALYRFARLGRARRDGWNWFFIPPRAAQNETPVQSEVPSLIH
ncbi:MAG TPA: hypothetical protein VMB73_26205 [Acetobacteraceae bacterium]|nr:hypothetical protein [Acetobacteraceae bacterium]